MKLVEAKRMIVATTALRPMPKIVATLSCLVMACTSLCCVLMPLTGETINHFEVHYACWRLRED